MNILSPIFVGLAGLSNALMDLSAENRFLDNKFNKTKGNNNDENKWKQPLQINDKRPWYYFGIIKPRYVEAFPYSSTALVSITDWWHRFQSLMLIFFCLAIVCYTPVLAILALKIGITNAIIVGVLDFVLFRTIFSLSFEFLYKRLKLHLLKKERAKRQLEAKKALL
jgi:hypothetical protein